MMDFLWIMDPTAWLGLLTLVVLEIVLGIDNLLFIAILAESNKTNNFFFICQSPLFPFI